MEKINKDDEIIYKGKEYLVEDVESIINLEGEKDQVLYLVSKRGKKIILNRSQLIVSVRNKDKKIMTFNKEFKISTGKSETRRLEIIKNVADKEELDEDDTKRYLEVMFELITETLMNGEEVSIHNFGKFVPMTTAPKKGMNPITREEIYLPPTNVVKFRAAPALKNLIDPYRQHSIEILSDQKADMIHIDQNLGLVESNLANENNQLSNDYIINQITKTKNNTSQQSTSQQSNLNSNSRIITLIDNPREKVKSKKTSSKNLSSPTSLISDINAKMIEVAQITEELPRRKRKVNWWILSLFIATLTILIAFFAIKLINAATHGGIESDFLLGFNLKRISLSREFVGFDRIPDDLDWLANFTLMVILPIPIILLMVSGIAIFFKSIFKNRKEKATKIKTSTTTKIVEVKK